MRVDSGNRVILFLFTFYSIFLEIYEWKLHLIESRKILFSSSGKKKKKEILKVIEDMSATNVHKMNVSQCEMNEAHLQRKFTVWDVWLIKAETFS